MKSTLAKRCALIGIATLAAGVAVNQASAATRDDTPRSVVVRYSDLNLSQPQDARTLYDRIQRAARVACRDISSWDLARVGRFHSCVDRAVTNAVAAINVQQVTEIHEAETQRQSRS